jgi:anthranilate synthase component II
MEGKILVVDNYDSFTYNLVYMVKKLSGKNPDVFRHDEISLDNVENYEKIILSPGPGIPNEFNLLNPLINVYSSTKSILGICLGLQAIGEAFGAKLINTKKVYHGVAHYIQINDSKEVIFQGLHRKFKAGRYHSWVLSKEDFPNDLKITALGPLNEIMAIRHQTYEVRGLQFHPESILTPQGERIIVNWLR